MDVSKGVALNNAHALELEASVDKVVYVLESARPPGE